MKIVYHLPLLFASQLLKMKILSKIINEILKEFIKSECFFFITNIENVSNFQ